jgi:pyrimidine operon attenuation protein/uracil phosphoribosyltransferase
MTPEPLLGKDEIARTVRRLGHEIVENNRGTGNSSRRTHPRPYTSRGWPRRSKTLKAPASPWAAFDIGLYRDDLTCRVDLPCIRLSDIPANIDGATVVLVDDVLFTGRSIRAALDALLDYGRPARVRLAVLVDRGHRELPIRPDFVGKNIPTALPQDVQVRLAEVDGDDSVYVLEREASHA